MAPTTAELHEAKAILGARETLIKKLHPHVFSFSGYYAVGIGLIVWDVVLAYLFFLGPRSIRDALINPSGFAAMYPILVWAGGAVLVGLAAVRNFSGAFRVAFWAALVIGIVLGAIMVFLNDAGRFAPWFAFAYDLFLAIISVFAAETYRHAFTYYITDMRVIIRYKLFSTKETDQRFAEVDDWKISQSFLWRILGIGSIRAYTGTEEGKYDPNRAYDAPDECLFGVKNPGDVKRILVDLMLDRDRLTAGGGNVAAAAPAATSTQPAPPPPVTTYYQPAPPPPPPARNYERVAPPPRQPEPEPEEEAQAVEEEAAPATRREPAYEGPVDPAAGAYPAPPTEPQPRRMFPEPEGGATEPVLVEKREMRFDEGPRSPPARAPRPPPDNELKPRRL